MDRKKEPLALNVLNSQIGLINVLTKPFFEEWTAFLEGSSHMYAAANKSTRPDSRPGREWCAPRTARAS